MAYTPIGWQTGDTITAEKLNKMDNGWGVETTSQVFFNGTVTTAKSEQSNYYDGNVTTDILIEADTAVITFNGTKYTCPNISTEGGYEYGATFEETIDFSTFPFNIYVGIKNAVFVTTENAGTYTLKIESESKAVEVSDDFQTAVGKATDSPILWCKEGVTTYAEMVSARENNKLMAYNHYNVIYIISSATYVQGNESVNSVECVPVFDNEFQTLKFNSSGVLTVYGS